jgi:hypothetical protein
MPLDTAGYQTQLIAEVGDDTVGTLAAAIDRLWTMHDEQPTIAAQYLYAKRSAIDVMLARVRFGADFRDATGIGVSLDQLFKHLQAMREDTIGLIGEAEAGGSAVGELTTTAPVAPPTWAVTDANSRAYRGDPYLSRKRRVL